MQGQVVAEAPEPLALQWAARNPWFGTDPEMTYYAYEVHDQLIEQEGLDPNSAEYYEQIGLRVQQQFPERWASSSTLCVVLLSSNQIAIHPCSPTASGCLAVSYVGKNKSPSVFTRNT